MLSLLFLLCLAYTIDCADIRQVKIEVIRNSANYVNSIVCTVDKSDKVRLNKVFTLKLYSTIEFNSVRCNTIDHRVKFDVTSYSKNFHYEVLNASMSMNSWECNLYFGWSAKTCIFNLNVVQDAVEGYLEVNGVKKYTQPVSPADKSLQEVAYYNFFDGELANISCHRSDNQFEDYLTLTCITKENRTITTEPILQGPVEMHIKLTAEYDGAYIDCNVTDNKDEPILFHVYRLYFNITKKTADEAALGFQVNDVTLTPIRGHDHILFFKYNYYDGEDLEIISLKDKQIHGVFSCIISGRNIPQDLQKLSESLSNNRSIHFTTSLKDKEILLNCSFKYEHLHDTRFKNDSRNLVSLKLQLIPNAFDINRPFITGLSRANTLLHYRKDELTDMIVYEYNDNKNLSLKCYSYSYIPQWEYKFSEVEGNVSAYTSTIISSKSYNYIKGVFKLTPHQNEAIIKCVLLPNKRKITVRLIRRNSLENIQNEATESSISHPRNIFIGCGVIVASIIIAAWTAVYLRKRTQSIQNPEQRESYEILSNQNETVPVSSQCSEVYATPLNTIEIDTYSVPYTPASVEEMYTKPIPKHQRPGVSYANLQFDKVDQVPAYATAYSNSSRDLKARGENYVQINAQATKNLNRQSVSTDDQNYYDVCNYTPSKYVNVHSQSQSYVKAGRKDDYVEPAYCEIGIKK